MRDMIAFVGRFHPLAVHVPIGVCLLVGLLEALTISRNLRRRIDPALPIILRLALVSAVVAFALGVMLASEGGHPERLVRLHQRLTFAMVLASAVSVVTWSMQAERRISRLAHRLAVVATLTLLGAGAHVGGSMTHGEGYLVQHAPAIVKRWIGEADRPTDEAAPAAMTEGSDPRVFDHVVLPILEQRCGSCHGAETAKGQLRVDSFEALMKGGRAGAAVVAGDARRSLLMRRVERPLADDGHMPPEGKPQLTTEEVELLGLWIDRGASTATKVRELTVPDGARRLLLGAARRANEHAPAEPAATTSDVTRAPLPPEPTESAHSTAPACSRDEAVFRDRVAPVLAAKCGRCHGASRQRGGLRTDSLSALLSGGKSGPAIVAGEPGRGTLLDRVRLPVDDDHHMPPREEPQLDASELRLLSGLLAAPGRTANASGVDRNRPTPTPPARFDVIGPILVERCGRCHSGAHPAGGLAVTDPDVLTARSYVVPGRPDASPLLSRLMLPLDDDDHMPPKTAPQPSRAEIDAIRSWIEGGAGFARVVEAHESPPETRDVEGAADPKDRSALTVSDASRARIRGGCAGCTVNGSTVADRLAVWLGPMLIAALALRRTRRSR